MSMPHPSFVAYKYEHGDPHVSGVRVAAFWLGLPAFAAVSLWYFGGEGIVPVIVLAVALLYKWPHRRILVGARYVVCGHTLAYYRNVRRMVLRPGTLTLHWDGKRSWTLEEKRFPTNARKDHKIKANKAAKFKKVSEKIIRHVVAEAPAVELVGIDPGAYTKAAA